MELLDTDACTLPTAERPLRVAEFDGLFADHLTATAWVGERLRLSLSGGPGLRDRVDDLTGRETECCSFFDFELTGSGPEIVLEVGVPPARREILAGLAALAREAQENAAPPGPRS
jgi:hypothetical protein